jgi:hypothetical protein
MALYYWHIRMHVGLDVEIRQHVAFVGSDEPEG